MEIVDCRGFQLFGFEETLRILNERRIMVPKGEIFVEFDGNTYSGEYEVERGTLTVSVPEWGVSKSTHTAGGENPKPTARMLLREIVKGELLKK